MLVYAPAVLPRSQTFVADQMRYLTAWDPCIIGRERSARPIDLGAAVSPLMPWSQPPAAELLRQRMTRRIPVLEEEVRRRKPALVHAHFLTGGFDVMRSIGTDQIPIVVTAHGFDATWAGRPPATLKPHRWLHGTLRRKLLRSPISLIAVSDFIRRALIKEGADPSRITVHYTGVDTDLFRPPAHPDRSGILFVGRLVQKKGVLDLLSSAALLRQRGIEPEIRIIGEGPERLQAERYAARLRLRVRFVGEQPRDVVIREMQRAAVLCNPSRAGKDDDREGFGMVLAEAQASGLPVVATRSGGMTEAVDEGSTGILVAEGDTEALAVSLERLLTDVSLHARMASAARTWVVERFDLRKQNELLQQIYQRAASGPK